MNDNIEMGIYRRPVPPEQSRRNILIFVKALFAIGVVLFIFFSAYAIINLTKDDPAENNKSPPKAPYTWPEKDHMKLVEKFKPTEVIPEVLKVKTDIKIEIKK